MVEQKTAENVAGDSQAAAQALHPLPKMIGAEKAVNRIARFTGGHVAAKELLIDRLDRGRVHAFAEHIWRVQGDDVKAAWTEGPVADAQHKVAIKRRFFRRTKGLVEDSFEWSWPRGRFFVRSPTRRPSTLMMSRVQFDRADIEQLARDIDPKIGRGGRPTETESWTKFWLEVVQLCKEEKLNYATLRTKDALKFELWLRLGWDKEPDPPLTLPTLLKPSRLIWERFVKPIKPK